MLFNKWLKFGMDALAATLALMAATDWSALLSPGAAMKIAAMISFVRAIMSTFAPAPGSIVIPPPGK